jgi:hypothetical protein
MNLLAADFSRRHNRTPQPASSSPRFPEFCWSQQPRLHIYDGIGFPLVALAAPHTTEENPATIWFIHEKPSTVVVSSPRYTWLSLLKINRSWEILCGGVPAHRVRWIGLILRRCPTGIVDPPLTVARAFCDALWGTYTSIVFTLHRASCRAPQIKALRVVSSFGMFRPWRYRAGWPRRRWVEQPWAGESFPLSDLGWAI